MSFIDKFFKSRDKPKNQIGSGISFLFGPTSAGKIVDERTSLTQTAVYACVRILSESIGSIPLHVYSYKEDGGKEKDRNHPLYRLLHDEPNKEMTSFIFRETMMCHLLLWGNAYAQIVRNGRNQVIALYPLKPSKVEVSLDRKSVV